MSARSQKSSPPRSPTRSKPSHAIVWDVLLAAIVLHVLAIAGYAAAKGQNLLRPMITGRKVLPANVHAPRLAGAGAGGRPLRGQRRSRGADRQFAVLHQLFGGTTWPRISPAGWDWVCTLMYHSPAANCLACSGVSVALPVIGFVGGRLACVSQITTGAFWPAFAGPWKCAIVTGLDIPL